MHDYHPFTNKIVYETKLSIRSCDFVHKKRSSWGSSPDPQGQMNEALEALRLSWKYCKEKGGQDYSLGIGEENHEDP